MISVRKASLLLRFKKKNTINCESANEPERSFFANLAFSILRRRHIYDSKRRLGFVGKTTPGHERKGSVWTAGRGGSDATAF